MVATCHPDHIQRYRFARDFATGKRVLDVGCAAGYGSAELAEVADSVVGIDPYADGVEFARRTYPQCEFRHEGVFDHRGEYDLIVSFEVIEHVEDAAGFASAIQGMLTPGGTAIISTPNKDTVSPDGGVFDPAHVREYRPDEFRALLEPFASVELWGQHVSQEFWDRADTRAKFGRADKLRLRRVLPPKFKSWLIRRFTKPADAPLAHIDRRVDGAFVQIAVAQA